MRAADSVAVQPAEHDVESLLAGYPSDVREIARRLRQLVLAIVPEAIEQVDLPARMLAYGLARTYKDLVCVIMPLRSGVNLGFPRGAELAGPAGLLTGTGKRARHVRIYDLAAVDQPAVHALIEASLEQVLSRGK